MDRLLDEPALAARHGNAKCNAAGGAGGDAVLPGPKRQRVAVPASTTASTWPRGLRVLIAEQRREVEQVRRCHCHPHMILNSSTCGLSLYL